MTALGRYVYFCVTRNSHDKTTKTNNYNIYEKVLFYSRMRTCFSGVQ